MAAACGAAGALAGRPPPYALETERFGRAVGVVQVLRRR